jgi:hypothetical protein
MLEYKLLNKPQPHPSTELVMHYSQSSLHKWKIGHDLYPGFRVFVSVSVTNATPPTLRPSSETCWVTDIEAVNILTERQGARLKERLRDPKENRVKFNGYDIRTLKHIESFILMHLSLNIVNAIKLVRMNLEEHVACMDGIMSLNTTFSTGRIEWFRLISLTGFCEHSDELQRLIRSRRFLTT